MVPFQIKICGVTKADDAVFACRSGADAIGLNFYEPSSRYVCPPGDSNSDPPKDDAVQIVESVRQWSESEKATPVKLIGVFVNLSSKRAVEIASQLGLDGIQLHGDEPVSHVQEIRELTSQSDSVLIIRAVRTNPRDEQQTDPKVELKRIESEIAQWSSAGVDAVLLDAAVAGEFGGTGKSVDWNSVPKLNSEVPVILAGGLTAENVARAIQCSEAKAVDVASGVESSPGQKDDSLVRSFIESAKNSLREKT